MLCTTTFNSTQKNSTQTCSAYYFLSEIHCVCVCVCHPKDKRCGGVERHAGRVLRENISAPVTVLSLLVSFLTLEHTAETVHVRILLSLEVLRRVSYK